MRVQIQLLGGFSVGLDGQVIPAAAWRRDRGAALVKLLAVTRSHRIHREQVMEAFWPDLDPEAAGANLRKAIHFARRALGANDLIEQTADVIALALAADLEIDVDAFEAAAKLALRGSDPAACEAAADLYAGDLLPDDPYVDWFETPRQALRQRYADVLRAGKLWQRLIAMDPADEQAQCALMQAALDAGNRAEAIRLFNHLSQSLRIDLGVGPGAETVKLYEKALAVPSIDPVGLSDRIRASLAWGLLHLQSGDFAKAAQVGRETRELAMGAGLAREVGEASALIGLVAHMQGQWRELFRAEFIEWVRAKPAFVSNVFDGHLCLAEFCLCSAKGHHDIAASARELLSVAEGAGSLAGRGLASLVLGEAALFSGQLAEAERMLTEAEKLYAQVGAIAGRVLALQRLTELALARGQKWQAGRLIRRATTLAQSSWLAPHLLISLKGLEVRAASTPEKMAATIQEGDRMLSAGHSCQPCSMTFRTAAAVALAEAGEVEQVNRRLDEAERVAGMWNGGPWVAAVWEARGVQRRAEQSENRRHGGI
ncbi:BTAD domain-containing putative transcriptional regulator [Mesorhizobium qingshengii]|uniref:BTAD domain-containing putative transcriptional regulator n=1 Tax=Mesorhizobium qingshengii TaxID=1165689 RepID=A0ABT4R446_9HYPH|nr:BTAD domain-containing putative transcriptional regulator [Mesorhizobium qingshengii]MCZ8548539.1 BTAD domain-containing putative transcriptional regulator [Mesorhizobium qingshengii]